MSGILSGFELTPRIDNKVLYLLPKFLLSSHILPCNGADCYKCWELQKLQMLEFQKTLPMVYPEVKLPTNSRPFSNGTIAFLSCIDYTPHPTPHTPPSRDVFNPSENCYSIAKLVTKFFNYLLLVVSHCTAPLNSMLCRPGSKVNNNCEEVGMKFTSVNIYLNLP